MRNAIKDRACLHEAARWAVAYSLYDVRKSKYAGKVHVDYGDDEKFHKALEEIFRKAYPDTAKINKLWKRKKFEACKEDFISFVRKYLEILIAGELCEFLYDNNLIDDFSFGDNFEIAVLLKKHNGLRSMQKFNQIANHFGFDDDAKRDILRKTIGKIQRLKDYIKTKEKGLVYGKVVF